jgi:hypothetical protein
MCKADMPTASSLHTLVALALVGNPMKLDTSGAFPLSLIDDMVCILLVLYIWVPADYINRKQ